MNNIEFKALVKGLFLTQDQVRAIGGYKDQRQIRRFISGEQPPHKDLIEKLLTLDKAIDESVAYSANKAIDSNIDSISVIGYKNQQQFDKWSDGSLLFIELHLCLLFRLKKAITKLGMKLNIKPFDEDCYLDFIENSNLADNEASMAVWAAQGSIA